jgi:hypothetical protein
MGGLFCLSGDVEDVEFTARGRLRCVVFGWVVRDVVPVDDVIVPIPLTLFERAVLELEAAEPSAALFGVFGQWKLACVVVPWAEEVDRFAIGRCAEGEVELDCCHFDVPILIFLIDFLLLCCIEVDINYELLFPVFISVPWFTSPGPG